MSSLKDFDKTRAELKKLSQAMEGSVLQDRSGLLRQSLGGAKKKAAAKKKVVKESAGAAAAKTKAPKRAKSKSKRSVSPAAKKKSPVRSSSASRKQMELADNLIALGVKLKQGGSSKKQAFLGI